MKKLSKVLFLAMAVSLFTAASSHAQIEVRIRPVRPRTVVVSQRPPRPSARHVWVSEGWKAQGNTYAYRPGYWALPPTPHSTWVEGHWKTTRHGQIWAEGHWTNKL